MTATEVVVVVKRCPSCANSASVAMQLRTWRRNIPEKSREQRRRYAMKHPDKIKERKRRQYARNREKLLAKSRDKRAANYETYRDYWLRQKYGITINDMQAIYAEQRGKCPGCQKELQTAGRDTHVDHCHETGLVRGLLCRDCNILLGHSRDVPATLRRLAQYIENHNGSAE